MHACTHACTLLRTRTSTHKHACTHACTLLRTLTSTHMHPIKQTCSLDKISSTEESFWLLMAASFAALLSRILSGLSAHTYKCEYVKEDVQRNAHAHTHASSCTAIRRDVCSHCYCEIAIYAHAHPKLVHYGSIITNWTK